MGGPLVGALTAAKENSQDVGIALTLSTTAQPTNGVESEAGECSVVAGPIPSQELTVNVSLGHFPLLLPAFIHLPNVDYYISHVASTITFHLVPVPRVWIRSRTIPSQRP